MMVMTSRSRSQRRPALSMVQALASSWSRSHLLILATSLCSSSAFDSSPTSFGPKRQRYCQSLSSLRQEKLAVIAENDPFSPIRAADSSASTSPSTSTSTNLPDDLTSQELALRFQDVLAYFASVAPGDPSIAHFTEMYTPRLSLLRGRLDDLHLARCNIMPSTIPGSGNGLFATRSIEKGELVTLFPGDAILFRDGELEEVTGALFGILPSKDESISLTDDAARAYEIRSSSKHSIVGDPSRTDDFAYLGHIANDGAILTKGDDLSRTVYSSESAQAANAAFQDVHEGCHIGLFALQPIPKGREIFVSYGEGYWLSRGSNELYQESQRGDAKRGRLASVAATTTRKNIKGKSNKSSGRGF